MRIPLKCMLLAPGERTAGECSVSWAFVPRPRRPSRLQHRSEGGVSRSRHEWHASRANLQCGQCN